MYENMKKFLILIVTTSLFFSCARNELLDIGESTESPAATPKIYVSLTGVDAAGNGSQTTPYLTIQYAINNNTPPFELCIAAGTYNTTDIIVLAKGISLYGGYNPATWARLPYQTEAERAANPTVINYTGSYAGATFLDPSRVIECSAGDIDNSSVIEGLTINGMTGATAPSAVFINNGAKPIIRYNTINGGTTSDLRGYAIIVAGGSNPVIHYNSVFAATGANGASSKTCSIVIYQSKASVTGNTLNASSSSPESASLLWAYSDSEVTIDSNKFNLGNASSTNEGMRIETNTLAVITGNTLTGGAFNVIGIYSSCAGTVIRNNTINAGGAGSEYNAIRLSGATSALIEQNTITDASTASLIAGIEIYGSSSSSIIRGNVITSTSAAIKYYCIWDSSASSGNKIYSNFINPNGTFSSLAAGILCSNSSPEIVNNTILSNNTSPGGESAAVFLFASTSNSNPAILNNIISATGGGLNYGIKETTVSLTDPSFVQNNLFFNCSEAFYFDNNSIILTGISDVNTLLVGATTSSGNIYQPISLSGTGIVDPGDRAFLDSQGLDISSTYPGAMIDLAGIARTVSVSIGAYEY